MNAKIAQPINVVTECILTHHNNYTDILRLDFVTIDVVM